MNRRMTILWMALALICSAMLVVPVRACPRYDLQVWFDENGYNIDVWNNETGIEVFPMGVYNITVLHEEAGYKDLNTVGWYPVGTDDYHEVIAGPDGEGVTKQFAANETFGLYLNSPEGRFFTENDRQPDGFDHALVYVNPKKANSYIISIEDLWNGGDQDFDNMVFELTNVMIPPTACFTVSNTNPEVDEVIVFNASCSYDPDGGIVKYEWDWDGDGVYDFDAGNSPITTHSYDTYGVVYPTLRVTDNDNLTSETSMTITVVKRPIASFTWSPETPRINEEVTFDGSTSTPDGGVIVEWIWDFGDGTNATGEIVTHVYSECGDHIVTLTVIDSEGKNDSVSQMIHVKAPPHAEFTYTPSEPGTGETITFDASASTPNCGTIIRYRWDFGDGTPPISESDPTTTHTFTEHGTYNVTLLVVDSENESDIAWQLVVVTTHDVAVVDVAPESDWLYQGKLCHANISVTVTNLGDAPESFTLSLYYNITAGGVIGTEEVIDLLPGENRTFIFTWNTTAVMPCREYTITAVAETVPHESNTENNVLEGSTKVKVRLLGDVNDDGKVDFRDVAIAALAFGSYAQPYVHPRWNPEADITNDGIIDVMDVAIIARNFGVCG